MKKVKLKNRLIKWHRKMGLWLSFIMLVWFISGIVMLFYGFPRFTSREENDSLDKINAELFVKYKDNVNLLTKNATSISFYSLLDRPVIAKEEKGKEARRFFLDTKEEIKNVDSSFAYKLSVNRFNLNNKKYKLEIINKLDTWIPWERMTKHFPIYKFYFEDEENLQIYVSSKTGEILQQSTSEERIAAYFGAIPHWLYFKDLRRHVESWRWVIIIISFLGSIMSLIGIITGVFRLKRKKNNKFVSSPYSSNLYKWHHYMGFAFGFLVFTWVFSGMMSLVPARWFYNEKQEVNIINKWEQSFTNLQPFNYDSIFSKINEANFDVKKIEINSFDNKNIVIYKNTTLKSLLFLDGKLIERENKKLLTETENLIKTKFDEDLKNIELLTSYDNYYYSKSNLRTLPLLKANISNDLGTVIYIDPLTNHIMKVTNTSSRVIRWLYSGLHSLDFNFIYNSWFWLPLIIFLMIGGTIVSITGFIFTFKKVTKRKK